MFLSSWLPDQTLQGRGIEFAGRAEGIASHVIEDVRTELGGDRAVFDLDPVDEC